MPAPVAAGAMVGVVGRLAGKKGAQAAAGAAAKEGAEEAVEGGAKAVAGKVRQGLAMVQANQQQAQQKKQNMQQRLQDATREGASTGSTIGKGEFFHPSVGGYIEQREGRRGPVTIMAREEGEVETPVPQTEMKRGQPMVQQMELGALPDGFFTQHAHERLTDRRRTVDENESQEVQQRISQIVRQHTDSTGMYKKDSPRDFAIRTHIFDDHRQPDETLSMSNGDSIVGIVRPNPKNRNFPSLHTVMLRRSELSHAPQPFKPAELRVSRVFNNHGMSNSELRRKAKMNKSEAMDITWRLLKEYEQTERDLNVSMADAFDLGYPLIDYDDLHDKQRAIVDLISDKDNTRVPSYWDDPASGEFETEYYNMMFHPEKHHLYPDEAFDQYYRYLQHYYEASDKTRQLPHSKQIEIMDAHTFHPEHPAEIAELKMAGEFSHDPVWTSAYPHKAFYNKYHGLSKAVGVVKAQQTLDAFDHKKIEEAINPKSNTIIIASKPGSAEGMGSAQQSYLHNRLLAHLANLGKRAPNMNMITGVGRSKEWGNEHSITLSNVPHDLVDDIKELAHQFEQDSILHSPEGTTDALFAPPRGEATAGLRNPSLTQNTPSDYTQYPLGMNLTYADYFEKAVLVKERKSPEAMRHKREYDKKYESSPERVKYREDLNRERRRRGIYGSHDHMDVSHTEGGGLTLESQHANRGRHFKERGTLRPIAKSLREDLELLRNLLAGPMDEQDKKIGLAMVGMLEERHENDDDDDEEEKPKPKQTGFLSTLLR